MLITKEIEIDMGHRVTNHKSKCSSIHGHRYKIEVGVDDKVITTEGASDEGMVIDFGDLKEVMVSEIDVKFDHGFAIWEKDSFVKSIIEDPTTKLTITSFVPTAENLAKHWYGLIKPRLSERGIKIKHVKVWETPTSTATYQE